MKRQKKYRKTAVALRYDASGGTAPKVVAKGQAKIAEKIIETARLHNIPVREEPDIVAILATLELHEEIPATLYKAVAEILVFIYKLNHSKKDS